MRPAASLLLLLICLVAAPAALAQSVAVPPLQARVTDTTGTLTAAERSALEAKLAAFEREQGTQIAVLMVPSTGEETIEQYGIRVAEAWRLGREGVDDGAILIVAKDDRRLRIEVGYGLEGAIPDVIAKRIVADVVTPYFREGDFYTGIAAGTDAIMAAAAGEPLPEPKRRVRDDGPSPLLVIAFVVFLLLLSGFLGGIGGGRGLRRGVYYGGIGGIGGLGGGFGRGGGFGGGGGFSGGGGGFGGGGASGGW